MKRPPVMRFALAGWLVGAAAAARDIPVYREYTVPVSFAGDAGLPAGAADLSAPDLAANRELRETAPREILLGKEPLLDLGLGRGTAAAAPVPGKLTPSPAGENRAQDAKDRNWLVNSLTLPTLGQTGSNAAAAVIARDDQKSSRGWLVDEMAKTAAVPETPREQGPESEESDPFARDVAAAAESAAAKTLSPVAAPSAVAAARRNAPARDVPDPGRTVAPWPPRAGEVAAVSFRETPVPAGGLSQTRQLISEYVGAARPDFAALRASLVQAKLPVPAGEKPVGANSFGTLSAGRSVMGGTPASSGLSWQGGWRGADAGIGAPKLAEPLPPPVVPTAVAPRPSAASGGYKPAWY